MEIQKLFDKIKPCNLNEPFIFVSYSSYDQHKVFEDVVELQSRGFNVWIDHEHVDTNDETWREPAYAAIKNENCRYFIYYVSSASLLSENCCHELRLLFEQRGKRSGLPRFMAIDVEQINDITEYAADIKRNLYKTYEDNRDVMPKEEVLNRIMELVFHNNNERIRIHPKEEKNRICDYYTDIIHRLDMTAYEPFRFDGLAVRLVIPFYYDSQFFEDLCRDRVSFVRDDFSISEFERSNILSNGFLRREKENCVRYLLNDGSRRKIGLLHNATGVYSIGKSGQEIRFMIDNKIQIWLMRSGNAFLTIHMSSEDLSDDRALEFKHYLADIIKKNKITYVFKEKQEDGSYAEIKKSFLLKELIRNILHLLEEIGAEEMRGSAYGEVYNLTYGVGDWEGRKGRLAFLNSLVQNLKPDTRSRNDIEEKYHLPVRERKLDWAVYKKNLAVIGDRTNSFLSMKNGGLYYSVFNNYLRLYLYGLDVKCEFEKWDNERNREAYDRQYAEEIKDNMEFILTEELSSEKLIEKLFQEYVFENAWTFRRKLARLNEIR